MIEKIKNTEVFKFKKFSVIHGNGSMKVGVDGVLVGSWAEVNGDRGIDIGCGCGLIGLMAAQRNPVAKIDMIDIDPDSVDEAILNTKNIVWSERIKVILSDAEKFSMIPENQGKYDFVISNPPFFKSGVTAPSTPREKARHEDTLSPEKLLQTSLRLLKPGGTLSMIMTADNFLMPREKDGLILTRLCRVSDRPGKRYKRIMLTYKKAYQNQLPQGIIEEVLNIRDNAGEYSQEYKALMGEFYINF